MFKVLDVPRVSGGKNLFVNYVRHNGLRSVHNQKLTLEPLWSQTDGVSLS